MLTPEERMRYEHIFEEKANDLYKPFAIDKYKKYGVKNGLRNDDGTGVLAGLSSVGAVVGYIIEDGEKTPIQGHLRYRGYDIEDLVQEATIGFFTAINVYNFKGSAFSTFCYTCMRRMLISLVRKASRKKALPNSSIIYTDESFFALISTNDPESDYIAREDFERLKDRINTELSQFERDVLYYYLLYKSLPSPQG